MDKIINRGRGPEIAGTRITVYDILDYYQDGWGPARIASHFRISSDQVEAALRYIEDHREEVMANYQKILERCARGNPPEIQALLDATHAKYQTLWSDRIRQGPPETNHEGNSGG